MKLQQAALKRGVAELASRDGAIALMVKQHGVPDLQGDTSLSNFAALARSICHQQLAGRAAATIHGRFELLCDGEPTPERVLALSFEQLRSAGLSGNKAASITDLATKVAAGSIVLDQVADLSDDELVRELVTVRGIGEWTAQMFLIFQLGRLDVWPTLDYGVRNGYARLFKLEALPTPKQLAVDGERFKPYRSIAAWYCWRAADAPVAAS